MATLQAVRAQLLAGHGYVCLWHDAKHFFITFFDITLMTFASTVATCLTELVCAVDVRGLWERLAMAEACILRAREYVSALFCRQMVSPGR